MRDYEGAAGAVESRLRAIRASGDLSLALGPDADRELRELRRARGRDPDLRAAFALGWLHWHRQLTRPDGQAGDDGRRAYAELMPCFIRGLTPIPDGLFPDIAIGSEHEAARLLHRAMTAHDEDAILAAAALWRRIQAAVPQDAAEWPATMVMLCVALQGSFECTGHLADLDEAVDAGRRGASAIPPGDGRRARLLMNVAAALRTRFDHSPDGDRQYADEAIALCRQAIAATAAGKRERAGMLSSLGAALRARFERYRDDADLAESVAVARQALAEAKALDPDLPRYLANLAGALRARHAGDRAQHDLAEAVGLLRAALSRTPPRHPDHAANCANLAAALWARHEESAAA